MIPTLFLPTAPQTKACKQVFIALSPQKREKTRRPDFQPLTSVLGEKEEEEEKKNQERKNCKLNTSAVTTEMPIRLTTTNAETISRILSLRVFSSSLFAQSLHECFPHDPSSRNCCSRFQAAFCACLARSPPP